VNKLIVRRLLLLCLLMNHCVVNVSATETAGKEAGKQIASPTRIAILGDDLSATAEAAMVLSEAELSANTNLALLDRRTVSTTIAEQDLFASGMVSVDDALQIGKILDTEFFVVVDEIVGSSNLSVIVFNSRLGMRLSDTWIEGIDPEMLSMSIVEVVKNSIQKFQTPLEHMIVVTVASGRNINLSDDWKGVSDIFPELVARSLLASPSVIVLERKSLGSVNTERDITSGRFSSQLLAAAVLIDLDVVGGSGENNDSIRISAILSRPDGTVLGTIREEGNNLEDILSALVPRIVSCLKISEIKHKTNSKLEAMRFYTLSRNWKARNRIDLALTTAEAAYALNPDDSLIRSTLVNALFSSTSLLKADQRELSLHRVARGMNLLRQYGYSRVNGMHPRYKEFSVLYSSNRDFFKGYGREILSSAGKKALSAQEKSLYDDLFSNWLVVSPYAKGKLTDTWSIYELLNAYSYCYLNPEEYDRTVARIVHDWIYNETFKKGPAHQAGVMLRALLSWSWQQLPDTSSAIAIRYDLFQYLQVSEFPIVKMYGQCALILMETHNLITGNEQNIDYFLKNMCIAISGGKSDFSSVNQGELDKIALIFIKRNSESIPKDNNHMYTLITQQMSEVISILNAMMIRGSLSTDWYNFIRDLSSSAKKYGLDSELKNTLEALAKCTREIYINVPEAEKPDRNVSIDTFLKWLSLEIDAFDIEEYATSCPSNEPEYVPLVGCLEELTHAKQWDVFKGFAAPLVKDGNIYALTANYSRSEPHMHQTLHVWEKGTLIGKQLGSISYSSKLRSKKTTFRKGVTENVIDSCLHRNMYVAVLDNIGIFFFNLHDQAASRFGKDFSIPLSLPLSVASMNNILYVGTGDGLLMACETDSYTSKYIIASDRREKLSPFDDGPPVSIPFIMADTARERLVFLVCSRSAENNYGASISDDSGLWSYSPKSGKFQQLSSIRYLRPELLYWVGQASRDSLFIFRTQNEITRYDLNENTSHSLGIRNAKQIGFPLLLQNDKYLWTGSPFGQISTELKDWKPFGKVVFPSGKTGFINPSTSMLLLDKNHVVLFGKRNAWRLRVDNANIIQNTNSPAITTKSSKNKATEQYQFNVNKEINKHRRTSDVTNESTGCKGETNTKTAAIEEVNREIKNVAIIDATLQENSLTSQFRDYLVEELSNTKEIQIITPASVEDTLTKEALSVVSGKSPDFWNYKDLGQLCNADTVITVEFLKDSNPEIVNTYASIRIQFFDCRYGLKVTDRVFYSPLNESEQKAIAKDLAIIYSRKISKLNKFPESTKLIKFNRITTDEKSKNIHWIAWAAASYLDTLYLENLDYLVLEHDRMVVQETESQIKDKVPAILLDSILPFSIHMCYKKAGNGKYYYTLTMSLSKKGRRTSLSLPLIFEVNFVSKSSSVARLAKLNTNVTEAGMAKMRLMSAQAAYFEQAKEYDKALSLFEALVALDPQNSIYKERRDKLYKDFSSTKEE